MLAVATTKEPLEVHLTGHGISIIEVLGPAAIVIAALAGAWFAARYASRNVARELTAANQRLELQMSHDRALRNKQASRETLDEVVAAMSTTLDSIADFAAAVESAEHMRNDIEDPEISASQRHDEKVRLEQFETETLKPCRDRSLDTFLATHSAKLRLRLRFPNDHPIIVAFSELQDAVDTSHDHFADGLIENRSDEEVEKAKELATEIPKSLTKFVDAVRTWNNSTQPELG